MLTTNTFHIQSGDYRFHPSVKEANIVDIDRKTAAGCVNHSVTATSELKLSIPLSRLRGNLLTSVNNPFRRQNTSDSKIGDKVKFLFDIYQVF